MGSFCIMLFGGTKWVWINHNIMIKKRIASVDLLRGFTIALMILVNTPGTWSTVYPPLLHAKWHGLTPTDLVFPFFLFVLFLGLRIECS